MKRTHLIERQKLETLSLQQRLLKGAIRSQSALVGLLEAGYSADSWEIILAKEEIEVEAKIAAQEAEMLCHTHRLELDTFDAEQNLQSELALLESKC